ncbi:TetR/AcrR family transcriptional regulator [Longispora albida]|uniref:TetR/AcrR family transcriptional regulator n=1 Tax=Longispora albida TaxID=203523 RepID=UPI000378B957|nr:TetR family transcriptional regulator [Longispora albida]
MTRQSTPPELGLRAQKKAETRQAISDAATTLFLERGFEQTTIADIAAAARVAKMTVTNYFPRKEDMALDRHEEFAASLAATVAGRRPGQSALDALRESFLADLRECNPVTGFSGPAFARMIADSPTLSARLRDLHDLREEALAGQLAADTGTPGMDMGPRSVAALLGAAHRVLFGEIQRRTLAGESNEDIAAAVLGDAERAFALLGPSLGDYAVRA